MEPILPSIGLAGNEIKKIDGLGVLLKIICFVFPLAGFIMYFAMRRKNPYPARQALIFSLLGTGANIFVNIVYHTLQPLM